MGAAAAVFGLQGQPAAAAADAGCVLSAPCVSVLAHLGAAMHTHAPMCGYLGHRVLLL